MTQEQQHILTFVAAIRRHWLSKQAALWSLVAAGGLLACLLTMVLLDNSLMLTGWQILLGWAAFGVSAVSLGAFLFHRLVIRPPGEDRLALLYESRVEGVENRLINAVQMIAADQTERDPVACAMVMENAALLDLSTTSQAVDYRRVRQMGTVAGTFAVLLAFYGVLWPAWMANGMARVLRPLAPRTHLLATEPMVTPGNVHLIEGAPLTITAAIHSSPQGRPPETVSLEYRVGQLDWTSRAMTRGAADEFDYLFAAVPEPMEYRVRAGRSVSPSYVVHVQMRPRIEALHVKLTQPAYAGGKSRQLPRNTGHGTALEHSMVDLAITGTKPLSAGQVKMSDNHQIPLTISSDGMQATGRFELRRSCTYTITITDAMGLANLDPPRYALIAEPDQPPVLTVPRPGRELTLPLDATLPLAIEAYDDVGLASIGLQVRTGTADWKTVQEWKVGNAANHHLATATLALGTWGLKAGDMLLYRGIATDTKPPQPNIGIGRTWSVTLTDPAGDDSILRAQARQLLEALQRILAMQRHTRAAFDMDRPLEPIRTGQQQVRDLTAAVIAQQQKSLRPMQTVLDTLTDLADGPMLQTVQSLARLAGTYQQRVALKPPIVSLMDEIIKALQDLIGQIEQSLAAADQAEQALEKLPPADREQALRNIRDLLTKLRTFIPEQDQVIEGTQEIVRKGDDLTDQDKKKIEQLKGTQDKWDEIFTDSVKDIAKLTEQGLTDRTIANDYKEMVEQIEEASLNLTPTLITQAVPREQAGREMAESLAEEMEMWLPNSPDHTKWIMEEPLDQPVIPMPDLPDQLSDFIGDLIEEQDDLNDAAEDVTSAWADSISAAGWEVADGPISNYSAVGKTGNQLPDNHELSGRAGDGRSGRSQGQLLEDVAKGLQGRKTPTRITNDSYEEGVVKELQQMATGGATGGGKARGAGQEGLQGQSPPPLMRDMQFMKQWQQRIRQKAEKVAGQLQQLHISSAPLDTSIALMKQAEKAADDGKYDDLFARQQMVLQNLKMAGDLSARQTALHVNRAQSVSANRRAPVLDAMDEPVVQEYEDAVRRYFLQLSETK